MVNKKSFVFGMFLVCILTINILLVSAQVSYCCEKTVDLDLGTPGNQGGWCIDAPQHKCDTGNNCGEDENGNPLKCRSVPTSCEATSYCRLGTCINTKEGTCMENTPQVTCNTEDGGFWKLGNANEIPQCQLGCCLIGDQAAFVTQTRCKSLSSLYKLETNYRTDIQSEIQCIASASPGVKGACVFEKEYQRTCELSTKKECQDMESENLNVEFHEGYLCSATELATNCNPRGGTTCVDGKDDVYFLDGCGNLANVYDSQKQNIENYWTYITAPTCSGSGCGDCDYLAGSTCGTVAGKEVCKDLGCKYEGNDYQHGETWCADAEGVSKIKFTGEKIRSSGQDLPGGRYFRMVCYNGEVTVEPCADYRQEICIQSEVGTFRTASCRVNMWQDCYSQDNQKDCENSDKRECKVVEGFSILKDDTANSLFLNEDGEIIDASCVPTYAPGFNFWEEGDAESFCSLASTTCIVKYEKGLFAGEGEKGSIIPNEMCMEECVVEDCGTALHVWRELRPWKGRNDCEKDCANKCKPDCVKGKEIDDWKLDLDPWKEEMGEMCISLGDCGSSLNYLKQSGYYDIDDFITTGGEEDEED